MKYFYIVKEFSINKPYDPFSLPVIDNTEEDIKWRKSDSLCKEFEFILINVYTS